MECEILENDSRSEQLSTAQNLEIVTGFLNRWAGSSSDPKIEGG
jgi:hypothetical protein